METTIWNRCNEAVKTNKFNEKNIFELLSEPKMSSCIIFFIYLAQLSILDTELKLTPAKTAFFSRSFL